MSDKRLVLTSEQAIAMLPDGDTVHTFSQAGPVLVGAGWSRKELLDLINTSACELAGETAASMGHGLVVWRGDTPLFVETKGG